MPDKIRVLIVDDSALVRDALKSILESDGTIEVIGMAKNGIEGVAKALALKPNVITMDLKMPISLTRVITDMIKVLTMPKAATTVVIVTTMNITVFSSFKACRKF